MVIFSKSGFKYMKTLLRNFVEVNFYWKDTTLYLQYAFKQQNYQYLDKNLNFSIWQRGSIRVIFVLCFVKQPHFTTPDTH